MQQTVDHGGVQPVDAGKRIHHALCRQRAEIQPGGAEGEVEVRHHCLLAVAFGKQPADVVGDDGGADTALGPQEGGDAADVRVLLAGKQRGEGRDELRRRERHGKVVVQSFGHQPTIEQHVVDVADDHHARALDHHLGELRELFEDTVAVGRGLHHQQLRSGGLRVGLHGGEDAALENLRGGAQKMPAAGHLPEQGDALRRFREHVHVDGRQRRKALLLLRLMVERRMHRLFLH